MTSPLFSCVIPVKGARPYFEDAIASIDKQYVDVEIVVEDGDRELDSGQSDALNRGFAKAHGDWLFGLNADDIILPGALEKVQAMIFNSAKENGKELDSRKVEWVVGNQVLIDGTGKVVKCSVGNVWHDRLYHHAVPHVYGPSAFFRRELLEKVGGFDTSLKYCMDWDLWIKFMKAGAKFERIPEYIWGQRQWEGSKTQRRKTKEEDDVQWAEIHRMLGKNDLDVTALGNFGVRLWRMLNGNIIRQVVDGIRYRGKHYSEVMA